MKKFLAIGFLLTVAISAFAQTKTVTNADLEKYRQTRLAAERDYRENYEKLGFPSPAELERRNAESRRELAEYAARLRQERAAQEYADAVERQNAALAAAAQNAPVIRQDANRSYYYGYPQIFGGYNYNYYRPRSNRFPNSEYIRRLRETDFINRRNGYRSPFQTPVRPNRTVRPGRN